MTFPLRAVALAGLALLAGACTSNEDAAKDSFSKEFSCPTDRLSVVPRTGVDAYELTFGKPAEPAADVKADPGRYAVWKKDQQAARDSWNNALTILEVKGCDHDELYGCMTGTNQNHNQVQSCSKLAKPTPAPRGT